MYYVNSSFMFKDKHIPNPFLDKYLILTAEIELRVEESLKNFCFKKKYKKIHITYDILRFLVIGLEGRAKLKLDNFFGVVFVKFVSY